MHGLFRWCVERWPSAVALRHYDREVTYAELDAMSGNYAVQLERLGVRRGRIVPVLMSRTPEFIAVLLAVLKRGAAYAALDPRWPQARLVDMMTMLKATVVITAWLDNSGTRQRRRSERSVLHLWLVRRSQGSRVRPPWDRPPVR
jgi:non-ribosomal peptide synthetase component F